MTKFYRLKIITIYLVWLKGSHLIALSHKGKTLVLDLEPLFRLRKYLPYFGYVSFFDCDSARYYAGHELFALNSSSLRRKRSDLDRYSDGTIFREISPLAFFKIKIQRMRSL